MGLLGWCRVLSLLFSLAAVGVLGSCRRKIWRGMGGGVVALVDAYFFGGGGGVFYGGFGCFVLWCAVCLRM